ncbi:catechol O-methyltransferase A-like isoform X2 [Eleutherodactylus coqui]|uniref:catechol O-methyltransferase A-like isoform X2 n=1 Tax=Eleutherodactylus coqui TaxID=57060 RepID=UPI003462703D
MLTTVLTLVALLLCIVLLVRWRVRTNADWALWWHDNYLERIRDFLSGTTRPVRILKYVQRCANSGDVLSVISAIDAYCSKVEWAMNVGDEKGAILDAVVLETRPRYVLELGTYCGYSTLRIAHLLAPGARLITLEMNPHYAQVAIEMFRHAGLDAQECGLLKAGSVLLADNVTCPGAPDYLQYVRNSPRYQSQYFPARLEYLQVEDGVEKSVFLG